MSQDLTARLDAILRAAPSLMRVMETARELDLPDALLFSGAIYQRALNHLTGRDPDYGIKDYDLGYFDPDTSYEAEDVVIKRVAAAFEPPLREMVEVRNQARVHLWFEGKFGEPYAALGSSAEALGRFTSATFAVGARLERDGRMTIVAPFGLEDIFALRLRPNPTCQTNGFLRTAEAAQRRWPELTIEA
ncbi:nucleotidyltransferase family protein [Phenylobacterium sp.]|uniref:nucleotidyltransferase family protein n=1 Tax=Phenylobacterium sp. TaxID=1871053 RepID=UPI0027340A33|nr:nucleotidyltransferase family protein [Phenylobacterium sp.]MDP3853431.1 nucleotidyltransferase family protein [Phenylobacterium sp.]